MAKTTIDTLIVTEPSVVIYNGYKYAAVVERTGGNYNVRVWKSNNQDAIPTSWTEQDTSNVHSFSDAAYSVYGVTSVLDGSKIRIYVTRFDEAAMSPTHIVMPFEFECSTDTWDSQSGITVATLDDAAPGIVKTQAIKDQDGNLHVFFTDRGNSMGSTYLEAKHTYSSDSGATWSTPTEIYGPGVETDNGNFIEAFAVQPASGISGNRLVAFVSKGTASNEVAACYSDALQATSWTRQYVSDTNWTSNNNIHYAVVRTMDGNFHIFGRDTTAESPTHLEHVYSNAWTSWTDNGTTGISMVGSGTVGGSACKGYEDIYIMIMDGTPDNEGQMFTNRTGSWTQITDGDLPYAYDANDVGRTWHTPKDGTIDNDPLLGFSFFNWNPTGQDIEYEAINVPIDNVLHSSDTYLVEPPKFHRTDALLQQEDILDHTTDSFLQRRIKLEYNTDSLLTGEVTKAHTTDSWLLLKVRKEHTADSYLYYPYRITYMDFEVKAGPTAPTETHTTDSLLKKQIPLTHTTDSYIIIKGILTHTTDSFLARVLGHSTDSHLEPAIAHSTDSFLAKVVAHSTDSHLEPAVAHTTDSFLAKVVGHSTDAYLAGAVTLEHSTDSLLKTQVSKNHTTDSYLVLTINLTHTTDSYIQKAPKTHSTDSYLTRALKHLTDSSLLKELTLTHSTDSQIGTVSVELTHSTDSLLKGQLSVPISDVNNPGNWEDVIHGNGDTNLWNELDEQHGHDGNTSSVTHEDPNSDDTFRVSMKISDPSVIYNVGFTQGQGKINADYQAGQKITLSNQKITKVTMPKAHSGATPTGGTFVGRIWNGITDGSPAETIIATSNETYNLSDLDTAYQDYEFTFNTTYLTGDYWIGFEYNNRVQASGSIQHRESSSGHPENLWEAHDLANWTEDTNDLTMTVEAETQSNPIDPAGNLGRKNILRFTAEGRDDVQLKAVLFQGVNTIAETPYYDLIGTHVTFEYLLSSSELSSISDYSDLEVQIRPTRVRRHSTDSELTN